MPILQTAMKLVVWIDNSCHYMLTYNHCVNSQDLYGRKKVQVYKKINTNYMCKLMFLCVKRFKMYIPVSAFSAYIKDLKNWFMENCLLLTTEKFIQFALKPGFQFFQTSVLILMTCPSSHLRLSKIQLCDLTPNFFLSHTLDQLL